jgi:hypothetical protein
LIIYLENGIEGVHEIGGRNIPSDVEGIKNLEADAAQHGYGRNQVSAYLVSMLIKRFFFVTDGGTK